MSALLTLLLLSAPAHAHAGHGSPEPWRACAEHRLGEACAWEDATAKVYRGTCRSVSDALLCVRNQPIVSATETAISASPEPSGAAEILGWLLALGVWLWAATRDRSFSPGAAAR